MDALSSAVHFRTVGVISRRNSPELKDSVGVVCDVLARHGVTVLLEAATAAMMPAAGFAAVPRDALGARCDLVVVVGGDGSLLGVGRELVGGGVPVLGVNRGGLGFLADIAPDRIAEQLGAVLAGRYLVEDHFLLEARVTRGGTVLRQSTALNDVVIRLGAVLRMLEFSLWINGAFVYEQRSDGLIIASPTGSTAYALSAGGPIMHPSLDALAIVPMFPHTLTSRPLVVPGTSDIRVVIGEAGPADALVSCDSQVDLPLARGDEVHVAKHATPLRLVYTEGHSFYESCRSKLDWGTRLGGRRQGTSRGN